MKEELFLTEEELYKMTGYKSGQKQATWLKANRIDYFKSKTGKPVVIRTHLQRSSSSRKQKPHFDRI